MWTYCHFVGPLSKIWQCCRCLKKCTLNFSWLNWANIFGLPIQPRYVAMVFILVLSGRCPLSPSETIGIEALRVLEKEKIDSVLIQMLLHDVELSLLAQCVVWRQKLCNAAQLIQAWWRSCRTRRRLKDADAAIARFQKSFRWVPLRVQC